MDHDKVLVPVVAALPVVVNCMTSLRDYRGCAGQNFEDPQRAVRDNRLEGFAEQEIANQHGRFVALNRIGRVPLAAQISIIDNIFIAAMSRCE